MSKPLAVIRTLEDSPVWLDRRLVEAYLRTNYRVFTPHFDLTIGQPNHSLEYWLKERSFETCAIITAWNPASQPLSATENHLKNKNLEVDLRKVSCLVLPAMNVPDTDDWPPEESFFALDISIGNAVFLGRKYGQNAVVWWEKGGPPELWWL